MIFTLLGIAFIIVATIMAYRTAKDYDRNAVTWVAIVFAAGFGIQYLLPFLIGILTAIILVAAGNSTLEINSPILGFLKVVEFVCFFVSIIAVILILRYLGKVPEDKTFSPPPTPPTFG